jgi:DNA-binding transcriptional ArsR family regulator
MAKTKGTRAPASGAKLSGHDLLRSRTPKSKALPPPVGPSAEIRRAAYLLKQASDTTRLRVLLILAEEEKNVGEICLELGILSQPAVSHHLGLLRHGRLIEPRRQGKNNIYNLTDQGRELAEVVKSVGN